MKKLVFVMGMVLVAAMPAVAGLIWSEDFSSVSEWSVGFNPSNDATVTSDGGLGLFTEPSPGTYEPHPAPAFISSDRIAFNPLSPGDYTFDFTVAAISNSMSFSIGFDCFSNDVTRGYATTVWDVFPNQQFVGAMSTNLGSWTFLPTVGYVSPKLTIRTGDGDQTVSFDSMSMDNAAIPEPGSMALIVCGGLAVALLRKRTR